LSLIASHDPGLRLASYALPGASRCVAGQHWRWDGVDFDILHPGAHLYDLPGFSENDLSCVLKVSGPYGSVLMTGDIARLGELSLVETEHEAIRSTILVVPHHGSGGSSMAGFIAAVHPQQALVSVGYRNRFHHPTEKTLARYRSASVVIERTDLSGALQLQFRASGLRERRARTELRRYWYEG